MVINDLFTGVWMTTQSAIDERLGADRSHIVSTSISQLQLIDQGPLAPPPPQKKTQSSRATFNTYKS